LDLIFSHHPFWFFSLPRPIPFISFGGVWGGGDSFFLRHSSSRAFGVGPHSSSIEDIYRSFACRRDASSIIERCFWEITFQSLFPDSLSSTGAFFSADGGGDLCRDLYFVIVFPTFLSPDHGRYFRFFFSSFFAPLAAPSAESRPTSLGVCPVPLLPLLSEEHKLSQTR